MFSVGDATVCALIQRKGTHLTSPTWFKTSVKMLGNSNGANLIFQNGPVTFGNGPVPIFFEWPYRQYQNIMSLAVDLQGDDPQGPWHSVEAAN